MRRHGDIGFRAEILYDDFLNVAVFFVQRADCQERIHALCGSFADADQDPRGEGQREPPGLFDGPQAQRGNLVRRLFVRPALA